MEVRRGMRYEREAVDELDGSDHRIYWHGNRLAKYGAADLAELAQT